MINTAKKKDRYPWLADSKRLIKESIVENNLMITGLGIDVPVNFDLDALLESLQKILSKTTAAEYKKTPLLWKIKLLTNRLHL